MLYVVSNNAYQLQFYAQISKLDEQAASCSHHFPTASHHSRIINLAKTYLEHPEGLKTGYKSG